ncbi:MAG: hypothetical protein RIC35_20705 [Marinoscillum sp.]
MEKRIEEKYADEMSKILDDRFNKKSVGLVSLFKKGRSNSQFIIKVEGAGVHWHCSISKSDSNERYAKIHCIEIDRRDITNLDYKGVMYDVAFYENEVHFTTGRTFIKEVALKSLDDWFNGIQQEALYSKYDFIDSTKKRLTKVLNEISLQYPSIKENAEESLVKEVNWSKRILIHKGTRSCEGYFYGYEDVPRFIFKWDETKMFEHSTADNSRVGELINDWVINYLMPSTLESKFKEVNFGKLGSYYEKGKGIEGEYVLSWDSIERFYGELSDEWHPFKKDAINLLKEMRVEGLDKELRAGQSLFFFILSRARRHGLENNHSFAHLTFLGENKMKIWSNYDDSRKEEEFEVKYEGYLKETIQKLLKEKIE